MSYFRVAKNLKIYSSLAASCDFNSLLPPVLYTGAPHYQAICLEAPAMAQQASVTFLHVVYPTVIFSAIFLSLLPRIPQLFCSHINLQVISLTMHNFIQLQPELASTP